MHHDHLEALHAVRDLGLRLKPEDVAAVDVSVHPPFTDLRTVQSLVEGEAIPVLLGAQHCSEHDRGAFTGEVSPQMLARLATRLVLVGHSERRHLFGMTDECVAATLRAILRNGMTPICCVGETEEERDAGATEERLRAQLTAALDGLDAATTGSLVIAYEPVWAIGTGRAAGSADAQGAAAFVREVVAELAGPEAAAAVRIQYGGSVNGENAAALTAGADVDGLLVGGASLDPASFVEVVRGVGAAPAGPPG
jgi:triosephosphate isomerase